MVTAIFSGLCFFSLFFHNDQLIGDLAWTVLIFLMNIPIFIETICSFLKLGIFFPLNLNINILKGNTSYFKIFEFITSFSLFIFCLLFLSNTIHIKIVEIFVLLRFFRFFQLLLNSNYLRSVFKSFFGCIVLFLDLFCVLFVLYTVFATFGQCFFGGLLNEKVNLTYKGNTYSPVYYSSNFNDLPNSFLILFSLMIVNNWNNQVMIIN